MCEELMWDEDASGRECTEAFEPRRPEWLEYDEHEMAAMLRLFLRNDEDCRAAKEAFANVETDEKLYWLWQLALSEDPELRMLAQLGVRKCLDEWLEANRDEDDFPDAFADCYADDGACCDIWCGDAAFEIEEAGLVQKEDPMSGENLFGLPEESILNPGAIMDRVDEKAVMTEFDDEWKSAISTIVGAGLSDSNSAVRQQAFMAAGLLSKFTRVSLCEMPGAW